ncbi:MAG: ABC transporter substrate-binding protein [Candidatus Calescibacterium sp.]|nr:ABC transporter substrate-binding protein [Candidatus Calescibacterium sp.]
MRSEFSVDDSDYIANQSCEMNPKRMKNPKAISIVLVLTLVLFMCSSDNDKGRAGDTVKIGGLVPLTGVDAAWGGVVATSFKYAQKEINEQGGLLGKDLEVVICDYSEDPEGVRLCLKKFISQGIKFVVGPDGSEALLSGVCSWDVDPKLAEEKKCNFVSENKIVVIATWPTSPVISELDDAGHVFRVCPSDEFQAAVLAEYILSEGITSVSVIYRDDWDGREFAKIFKKVFENSPESSTKGTVLSFVPYEQDKTENFRSEIEKLYENGDPEAIFLYTFNEDGVNFLAELRTFLDEKRKTYPKLFGCDCNQYPEISGGPAAEFVRDRMEGTTISPPYDDPDYQVFRQKIMEKFGDDGAVDYISYDAVCVIAAAIESAGEYDPEKVKAKLIDVTNSGEKVKPPSAGGSWRDIVDKIKKGVDIDYKGVSGDVDFLQNGDVKSGTYVIWRIEDTKGDYSDFKEIKSVKVVKESF